MSATFHNRPVTVLVLMGLLIFLGLGGLLGGVGLLLDTSGVGIGFSLEMLDSVPIDSFLLPGLILLILFGVWPLVVAFGLWAKPEWGVLQQANPWREYHWSWGWTRVIAVLQALWIGLEFLMWGNASFMQPLFMGVALAMLIMSAYESVKSWLRIEG